MTPALTCEEGRGKASANPVGFILCMYKKNERVTESRYILNCCNAQSLCVDCNILHSLTTYAALVTFENQ